MLRQRTFPFRTLELARAADAPPETPVLLNGMRVVFSERVALYPVGLDRTAVPAPDGGR